MQPRWFVPILLILIISLVAGWSVHAQNGTPPGQNGGNLVLEEGLPIRMNQELLQQLRDLAGDDPTISYHAQTGRVRFMSVTPGHAMITPDFRATPTTPEQAARSFLTVFGDLFGLADQSQDLSLLHLTTDDAGFQFVRFQQVYQGVPVLGGELIVQLNADLHTVAVTGEILPVPDLTVTPTFDFDLAQH